MPESSCLQGQEIGLPVGQYKVWIRSVHTEQPNNLVLKYHIADAPESQVKFIETTQTWIPRAGSGTKPSRDDIMEWEVRERTSRRGSKIVWLARAKLIGTQFLDEA